MSFFRIFATIPLFLPFSHLSLHLSPLLHAFPTFPSNLGLGYEVWRLGYEVWGLGYEVLGLGYEVDGGARGHPPPEKGKTAL